MVCKVCEQNGHGAKMCGFRKVRGIKLLSNIVGILDIFREVDDRLCSRIMNKLYASDMDCLGELVTGEKDWLTKLSTDYFVPMSTMNMITRKRIYLSEYVLRKYESGLRELLCTENMSMLEVHVGTAVVRDAVTTVRREGSDFVRFIAVRRPVTRQNRSADYKPVDVRMRIKRTYGAIELKECNCPICFNELEEGNVVQYECGHQLCFDCMKTCLHMCMRNKKKPSCHICRAPVKEVKKCFEDDGAIILCSNGSERVVTNNIPSVGSVEWQQWVREQLFV